MDVVVDGVVTVRVWRAVLDLGGVGGCGDGQGRLRVPRTEGGRKKLARLGVVISVGTLAERG